MLCRKGIKKNKTNEKYNNSKEDNREDRILEERNKSFHRNFLCVVENDTIVRPSRLIAGENLMRLSPEKPHFQWTNFWGAGQISE